MIHCDNTTEPHLHNDDQMILYHYFALFSTPN